MPKTVTDTEEEGTIFLPDEDNVNVEDITYAINSESEEAESESDTITGNQSDKGDVDLDNRSSEVEKDPGVPRIQENSGYGAIQRHLEKIEDRQRELYRCMSPAMMSMVSEVEDDAMPSSVDPVEFGEHLMQLQLLVQEMKDGFVLAMQELGCIQDEDRNLSERVETMEKNNQQMINDLTHSVKQLKTDLSSALDEVRKNSEVTKTLSEQMVELQQDRKQLMEEIQQQNALRESSKHKPSVDSDNNNSDSGKPHSNGDEWEGKKVSPMMQPFMDSLPDAPTGTVSPPCDSEDSDSSATKAATDRMPMMGKRGALREKYQRQRARSSDSDDPHDIMPDGKEGSTLSKKEEVLSLNNGQRLQIAQELLSSEKAYFSQLSFLKEKIVKPLIAEQQLSMPEINMMFPPCLNKLYQKHKTLLSTLENRLSRWKYQGMLGDIFARLTSADGGEFLQLYSKYMQSFSSSLSALSKQVNKSSMFQTFIKDQLSECSKEESDITVYLMAPIQRIPAYVMCLKKLSKCTDDTHPDSFHVDHCLKQLSDYVTNSVLDNPAAARKLSSTSQSSVEMSASGKESGIHSPDEHAGGPGDSIAALQKTWQECLKTSKNNIISSSKPTKSTTSSNSSKTEQKEKPSTTKASKTKHTERSGNRKTKSKPNKLEKRSQSQNMMGNPAWGYDPQMMYNQQMPGNYGMPPHPQHLPAYIYGHPQMMPNDGMYRGQRNGPSTMRTPAGASANVQYMLGRGFDPRLYEQMHQANHANMRSRSKSHGDLDYLIFEESEGTNSKEESGGEEREEPSYIPSTPVNAAPRARKHTNDKRLRRDGHHSPLSDGPASPIFDEPQLSSSPIDEMMLNSPRDEGVNPSQAARAFHEKFPRVARRGMSPQWELLARKRASIASVAPDQPMLLQDVWNDDSAPTGIDMYMERRRSVQDNRRAVLESLRDMEDRMAKKNTFTNSIKNMFRRRNLTDEPIDEERHEPPCEPGATPAGTISNTSNVCHTDAPAPHNTQIVTAMVHTQPFRPKKSVTLSSQVEEIPDTGYNAGDNPLLKLNRRRASAAAVLSFQYDENGDPCSAV